MSLSASLRRCAPSAARASISNASASSYARGAPKSQKRQPTLPPEKLRALISMYHQSDTFITQENLLEKINEALVPLDHLHKPSLRNSMPTSRDLEKVAKDRLHEPKLARTDATDKKEREANGNWTMARPNRMRRVISALYGLDMASQNHIRPGLEAVMGGVERLEKEVAEDVKKEQL